MFKPEEKKGLAGVTVTDNPSTINLFGFLTVTMEQVVGAPPEGVFYWDCPWISGDKILFTFKAFGIFSLKVCVG